MFKNVDKNIEFDQKYVNLIKNWFTQPIFDLFSHFQIQSTILD